MTPLVTSDRGSVRLPMSDWTQRVRLFNPTDKKGRGRPFRKTPSVRDSTGVPGVRGHQYGYTLGKPTCSEYLTKIGCRIPFPLPYIHYTRTLMERNQDHRWNDLRQRGNVSKPLKVHSSVTPTGDLRL